MSKAAMKARKAKAEEGLQQLFVSGVPSFSRAQSRILNHALAAQSVPDVLTEAARLVEHLVPGTACLIALVPDLFGRHCTSDRLQTGALAHAFGFGAEPASLLHLTQGTGETIEIDSFSRNKGWAEHGLRAVAAGFHSALGMPLFVAEEEKPIGALALYFKDENGPNESLVIKLESYAAVVAQLPGVMAARERSRTEQDRLAEIAGTIPGVVYQRVVRPDGEIR
ncbi:MAG: GAF domain-containing protein, partial [Proteobacteria bacterium]|nr:GAF domain-containing protein [Pseudomonadota bacterium]